MAANHRIVNLTIEIVTLPTTKYTQLLFQVVLLNNY